MAVEESFDAYAARRWRQLMRAAWLLTGDWASSEDLVQDTLVRVWMSWDRVRLTDEPDAYVRRVLTNEFLVRRRRRSSSEVPRPELPAGRSRDLTEDSAQRIAVLSALDELAPLQRTTLVLRYFEDLSVEQTAVAMGCSLGTVKSQVSRALRKLRSSAQVNDIVKESI